MKSFVGVKNDKAGMAYGAGLEAQGDQI